MIVKAFVFLLAATVAAQAEPAAPNWKAYFRKAEQHRAEGKPAIALAPLLAGSGADELCLFGPYTSNFAHYIPSDQAAHLLPHEPLDEGEFLLLLRNNARYHSHEIYHNRRYAPYLQTRTGFECFQLQDAHIHSSKENDRSFVYFR